MGEVRVTVPGASGWMGKVHTMACQTVPRFPGTAGGTATVVALVDGLGDDEQAVLTGDEIWADGANPDGTSILCKFASGARGLTDFKRVATGSRFMPSDEVYGIKGSLSCTCDEVNRLRLYTKADAIRRRRGAGK